MRLNPTLAESKLEKILTTEPFIQHHFRRQHPIANYIADFYSHCLKLVIEVDGSIHQKEEQNKYDKFRDEDMKQFGISIIRFSNSDVIDNTEDVEQCIIKTICAIEAAAKKQSPL